MQEIDIFASAPRPEGEFFSFKEIGDQVQGTYIGKREGTDGYGNEQHIYVVKDKEGKTWSVGFKKTGSRVAEAINAEMANVKLGQIIGFRFEKLAEKKDPTKNAAKVIQLYQDPRYVDTEYVAQEGSPVGPAPQAAPQEDPDFAISKPDSELSPEEMPHAPVGSAFPEDKSMDDKVNSAYEAVRALAKTKGVVPQDATAEQADAKIVEVTGIELKPENLTAIITKLTS